MSKIPQSSSSTTHKRVPSTSTEPPSPSAFPKLSSSTSSHIPIPISSPNIPSYARATKASLPPSLPPTPIPNPTPIQPQQPIQQPQSRPPRTSQSATRSPYARPNNTNNQNNQSKPRRNPSLTPKEKEDLQVSDAKKKSLLVAVPPSSSTLSPLATSWKPAGGFLNPSSSPTLDLSPSPSPTTQPILDFTPPPAPTQPTIETPIVDELPPPSPSSPLVIEQIKDARPITPSFEEMRLEAEDDEVEEGEIREESEPSPSAGESLVEATPIPPKSLPPPPPPKDEEEETLLPKFYLPTLPPPSPSSNTTKEGEPTVESSKVDEPTESPKVEKEVEEGEIVEPVEEAEVGEPVEEVETVAIKAPEVPEVETVAIKVPVAGEETPKVDETADTTPTPTKVEETAPEEPLPLPLPLSASSSALSISEEAHTPSSPPSSITTDQPKPTLVRNYGTVNNNEIRGEGELPKLEVFSHPLEPEMPTTLEEILTQPSLDEMLDVDEVDVPVSVEDAAVVEEEEEEELIDSALATNVTEAAFAIEDKELETSDAVDDLVQHGIREETYSQEEEEATIVLDIQPKCLEEVSGPKTLEEEEEEEEEEEAEEEEKEEEEAEEEEKEIVDSALANTVDQASIAIAQVETRDLTDVGDMEEEAEKDEPTPVEESTTEVEVSTHEIDTPAVVEELDTPIVEESLPVVDSAPFISDVEEAQEEGASGIVEEGKQEATSEIVEEAQEEETAEAVEGSSEVLPEEETVVLPEPQVIAKDDSEPQVVETETETEAIEPTPSSSLPALTHPGNSFNDPSIPFTDSVLNSLLARISPEEMAILTSDPRKPKTREEEPEAATSASTSADPPSLTLALVAAWESTTWYQRIPALLASFGINFVLPFLNGVALGFGELFARNFVTVRMGWTSPVTTIASSAIRANTSSSRVGTPQLQLPETPEEEA